MLGEADGCIEAPVDIPMPLVDTVDSGNDVALNLGLGAEMDPITEAKVAGVEPVLPTVPEESGREDPFVNGKGTVEASGALCRLVVPF